MEDARSRRMGSKLGFPADEKNGEGHGYLERSGGKDMRFCLLTLIFCVIMFKTSTWVVENISI